MRDEGAVLQPRVPRAHAAWRVEKAISGFRPSKDRSDQVPPRSRHLQGEPAVSQSELEQVVHEYRRVREEHHRARARSRTRRHLEARLEQLQQHFEGLLATAPLSERDRRRWRTRLRSNVAEETPQSDVRPLLFRGRSGSGSELRLTADPRGTVEADIGGAVVAVLDDADELTLTMPGFVFGLDGIEFRETFGASPSALADLRAAVETGRTPQRENLRALLEDGLIDRTLGLTPRGRRALALDRSPARHIEPGAEPAISTRGRISQRARDNLASVLADVAHVAPLPVLRIAGSLTRNEDPANARPFVAKATLDVSGRAVRAHVAAASERDAIDQLEARLRRNLHTLADRDIAGRREGQAPEPGEWRHGDRATPRPRAAP